ncbi:MAG: HDIG domain-containing metalloprotein, partial [Bacteroidota bacterium]
RTSLAADFSPYYRLNEELAAAKIKDLEAELVRQSGGGEAVETSAEAAIVQKKFLPIGKRLLENLYKYGIIQLAPEHQEAGSDFVINVVRGHTTYKRTLPSFLTVETAKKMAADSLQKEAPLAPDYFKNAVLDAISPNLIFDKELTAKLLNAALAEIVTTKGVVRQGDDIVQRNGVITDEVYERLLSFQQKFESDVSSQQSSWSVYAGYLVLTILILGAFLMYASSYREEILTNRRYLAFVLTWLLTFSYVTFLVERTPGVSVYVIPYCIVPIVVRHFFTYRLAFFTHVVVVLIAGFITSEGSQFLFTQIVAGVVAVLAVADARAWTRFFGSVLSILLTYTVAHLGLSLIEEGNILQVDWSMFGWLLLNGLLTMMAFPLIPLMERMFGFTSSISLVELSDMNRPLLRELAMKAPGTLQHSLQVANLAEGAAREIGANHLLIRVGALYHDVGKIKNPEYFIENQGNNSPHESLDLMESARIIIAHVPEGVRLAKKNRLPQAVIDFIQTHHGTTKTEFFYRNFLKQNPGIQVDEQIFTYPGPKPRTKEEALLMLADSIEATSRTMKDPTGKDIDDLVDRIIAGKLEKHQFEQARLTFGELEQVRALFKTMLRSVYHVRIEYPEELKTQEQR